MIYSTFIPALWCVEFNQTLNERAREFMFCQNDRFSTIALTLRLCQSSWRMKRQKERREKERERERFKPIKHMRVIFTHAMFTPQINTVVIPLLSANSCSDTHGSVIYRSDKHILEPNSLLTDSASEKPQLYYRNSALKIQILSLYAPFLVLFFGTHTHTLYIRVFLRSYIQNTVQTFLQIIG